VSIEEKPLLSTYSKVLTWWESEDGGLHVECARHHDGFRVTTKRAGQTSAERYPKTQRQSRELFEQVVTELVEENNL
jgi:hypothetical protein